MYEAVQNTDKEIRNDNVDKVAEQIKDIAIEMFGENAEEEHKFVTLEALGEEVE